MDETTRQCYEQKVGAWLAVEAIVQQLNKEKTAQAVAKLSSESGSEHKNKVIDVEDGDIDNDVFEENGFSDLSDPEDFGDTNANDDHEGDMESAKPSRVNKSSTDSGNVPDEDLKCEDVAPDEKIDDTEPAMSLALDESAKESNAAESNKSSPSTSSYETVANDFGDMEQFSEHPGESSNQNVSSQHHAFIITNASIDIANMNDDEVYENVNSENELPPLHEVSSTLETETLQEPKSACVSPASSSGGVYSVRKSGIKLVVSLSPSLSLLSFSASLHNST